MSRRPSICGGMRNSCLCRRDLRLPNPSGARRWCSPRNLGKRLGVKNLYFKNDAVCFPTLSFKDRVVATALAAARRFGFKTVSCSSTGNLANAVAAQAARKVSTPAFSSPPTWNPRKF